MVGVYVKKLGSCPKTKQTKPNCTESVLRYSEKVSVEINITIKLCYKKKIVFDRTVPASQTLSSGFVNKTYVLGINKEKPKRPKILEDEALSNYKYKTRCLDGEALSEKTL